MRGRWNHNTHYHRFVLAQVPSGARDALDVGCGTGELLADLVPVVPHVVGVEADGPTAAVARRRAPEATVEQGDFLTLPLSAASYDLVVAVASVHHMDMTAALSRMSRLVRPGGAVVVVGLARPSSIGDHLLQLAGTVASWVMRAVAGYADVQAPTVWPPPLTYAQCRDVSRRVLPGATFRRRLFFRYTVSWVKP